MLDLSGRIAHEKVFTRRFMSFFGQILFYVIGSSTQKKRKDRIHSNQLLRFLFYLSLHNQWKQQYRLLKRQTY